MTGWDPHALTGIVFGLFMISVGLLQLFDPIRVEQAHEARLRHGESSDLRRGPTPDRWLGFIFIAGGALNLLLPYRGASQPTLQIVMGGLLLGGALWSLLIQPRFDVRRRQRDGAEPRGPYSSRRRQLLLTLLMVLFGGAFLALGLTIPR